MIGSRSFIRALSAAALGAALIAGHPALAKAEEPIRIGVIAEAQAVAGSSIPLAAQLAADEINAKGGVNGRKVEIIVYDDHMSAADAVRAFQRAVSEDKVNAVIASFVSEVVLALQPWAARLKTVMITPGAASDVITANIAKDYEHNKYTFHGYLTSGSLARLVCDAAKDLLVTRDIIHTMASMFLGEGGNRQDPLANPLYGDLKGFPPMYIQTEGDETLLDDSRKLADLTRKSGVDVTLEIVPEMQHVFQFLAGTAPEADAAMQRLSGWVRPKLGLG